MMEQSMKTGTITVVAAAAINVELGFTPRYVRAWNVNNLASYEYFDGMAAGTSLDMANHGDTQNSVNAAGGISQYAGRAVGAALTGTGAVTAGSTTLTGTSTNFLGEVAVGDLLTVNGETRSVVSITSATVLVVDKAFVAAASGKDIFDMTGKGPGVTFGTDICDTAADVVRYIALR
jgi:hypothetical protein